MATVRVTVTIEDGDARQMDCYLVEQAVYDAFERRLKGWNTANWLILKLARLVVTH